MTRNYLTDTVLVTGGAGFFGSHIAEKLLRDGSDVVVVDALNSETSSREEKTQNIKLLDRVAELSHSRFSFYLCDILDRSSFQDVLEKERPSSIIHAAALVMDRRSVDAPDEFIMHNALGTQRILSAVRETDSVQNIVYISSRSAVGEAKDQKTPMTEDDIPTPINPYGASKLAAESFCCAFHENTGTPVTICRMQPMYGPRGRPDMMPRILLENIRSGRGIKKFGSDEATRDWLFVSDGVEGVLAAARNPNGFQIYNFGTGITTTLKELIVLAQDIAGKKANIIDDGPTPVGDAHCGGAADYTKAKNQLGWEPHVNLNNGLKLLFDNIAQNRFGELRPDRLQR